MVWVRLGGKGTSMCLAGEEKTTECFFFGTEKNDNLNIVI
jgi:hypothetical protein